MVLLEADRRRVEQASKRSIRAALAAAILFFSCSLLRPSTNKHSRAQQSSLYLTFGATNLATKARGEIRARDAGQQAARENGNKTAPGGEATFAKVSLDVLSTLTRLVARASACVRDCRACTTRLHHPMRACARAARCTSASVRVSAKADQQF